MPAVPMTRSGAWLAGGLALAALLALPFLPAVPEPLALRSYADERALFGLPSFWNVVSNLPFLAVGLWGLRVVAAGGRAAFLDPAEKWPYALCFLAIAGVAFGSSYYHLAPSAGRLMWDRLPIALGFMALLAAVVAERVDVRTGLRALVPLLAAGLASVLYWRWSALRGAEDIVPYAIVQYGALVAVVAMSALLPARYSRGKDLLAAVAIYAAAKIAEVLDAQIYALGEVLSGHTLKHLLAAAAAWRLVRMLELREPLSRGASR